MSDERSENLIAIGVVIVLATLAGWWLYAQYTAVPDVSERITIAIGDSPSVGQEEAPVVVVLFSDFECPFCATFATGVFPDVKRNLIDTGRVRLVFKPYPLDSHKDALAAATAAMCADEQGRFWAYHDLLFEHQDALGADDLKRYAQDAGLDAVSFSECVAGGYATQSVLREKTQGTQEGVAGTPTFFFNGRRVPGALSYEEFLREVLREEQAKTS